MDDAPEWLARLTGAQWLAAARTELAQGQARVTERRACITHARRAAGMALNAVLAAGPGEPLRWGRSYVDHLRALATADGGSAPLSASAGALAKALLEIPVAPAVIALGAARDAEARRALQLAENILADAEAVLVQRSPADA